MAGARTSRSRLALALRLVAACLVVGLALSWVAGSLMVSGKAGFVPAAVAPARDFSLRSADGLRLAATYRPGARGDGPAVLLLHGVDSSRASMAAGAEYLSRLGYATLTIDFRGHGQSQMAPRSFGLNEALDAQAAFDWLKRRQRGARVAVIGNSMGGAASLIGADGPLPADALVLQAVYPDIRLAIRNRIARYVGRWPAYVLEPLLSFQSKPRFGAWPAALSPRAALRRYSGPVLVVGSREDRSTPPEETIALFEAVRGRRSLEMASHGGHARVGSFDDPLHRARVAQFLAATIGRP